MQKICKILALPLILVLGACSSLNSIETKIADLDQQKSYFEKNYVEKLIKNHDADKYSEGVVQLAILDCYIENVDRVHSCDMYSVITSSGIPVTSSSTSSYDLDDKVIIHDDKDPDVETHTYIQGRSLFVLPEIKGNLLHLEVKNNSQKLMDIKRMGVDVVHVEAPVIQGLSREAHFTIEPNKLVVTGDSTDHYQSMIWVK